MTNAEAAAIATLLNDRNQLALHYDAAGVLEHHETYVWRNAPNGDVIACVQLKRVQWYQWEVSHVSVVKHALRQGHARALLKEVEMRARAGNARVLQCTIREGNTESQGLFESSGFKRTCVFNYSDTGNDVAVYQKVLAPGASQMELPKQAPGRCWWLFGLR